MGYYTDYRLRVEGSGAAYDKLMKEKDNIIFSDYDWNLGRWLEEHHGENCKWYDYETDMQQLSREWPNVLFILEGDGEEAGDLWKAWFRNGKMHKLEAKIVFETITPDLDRLLPIDYDLEKRLAADYRASLLQQKASIEKQLVELQKRLDSAESEDVVLKKTYKRLS